MLHTNTHTRPHPIALPLVTMFSRFVATWSNLFVRRQTLVYIICGGLLSHVGAYAGDRGADAPSTPEAIYGQGVRETNKLTPAEELAGFHLPTGFVAELVASEPQIAKPLNMAFDRLGRLWITDTTEYPYPAPADTPAHDSIKVLTDSDNNGSFESVVTFVDDLNIPIGILPVEDGVICYSIPNIMHLRDTDGDGRCDERKVLLGPFDTTRDTHGMVNALRQGDDGWIYACHGFNNQSHVTAADGSQIHLISGNTFRFRPDGSHVEQFTNGQVNPFGMTSDDFGHWYTADCHSKPVTLLVRGGYYESFGRPHDGLGFVPAVMDHLHGSTAICGINYYLAKEFPEEFRHKFYSGNVMTSRINSNRLNLERDRIQLVEEPDFMTSDDPWFRPVDIQLGPDGALYVADFYNKIIGHYEVRLDHPERDRTSGRIWRIAYRGLQSDARQAASADASTAAPASQTADLLSTEHLAELSHDNPTRRQFATQRLASATLSNSQQTALRELILPKQERSDLLRISAIWALHQHKLDSESILATALTDTSPRLLATVLKAWEDRTDSGVSRDDLSSSREFLRRTAREQLASDKPQIALAAAAALARHGHVEDVSALLQQIASRNTFDAIVPHSMRVAVKSLLQNAELADAFLASSNLAKLTPAAADRLAYILPAVNTPRAATTLLELVTAGTVEVQEHRQAALQLACRHMQPTFVAPVVDLLVKMDSATLSSSEEILSPALDQQTALAIEAMATLRTGRHEVPAALKSIVDTKLRRVLDAIDLQLSSAKDAKPIVWQEASQRLWPQQDLERRGEGKRKKKFISSLLLGESYVGVLSTTAFKCPSELSFWIAGHDGPPNMPAAGKNLARLVHAETNQLLKQVAPPRNDAAAQVTWDLAQWHGQPVRFECVDGDNGTAYAWSAVGGFSLQSLNPSPIDGAMVQLAKLMDPQLPDDVRAKIVALFDAPALSDAARARLAAGYVTARGLGLGKLLIELAEQRGQAAAIKKEIATGESEQYLLACKELASALAARMTLSQQTQMVRGLITSSEGRQLLIELVDDGRVANQSLRGLKELLGPTATDDNSQRLQQLSEAASAVPSEAEIALIQRIAAFKMSSADVEKGKLLYEKNCANCHKLRGAGQLVGPQLDGVGARGPERLAEDVLLPNRNVDKAFRMSSLLMEDDRVIVGLVRETGADELQIVGIDGKSQSIRADQIATRRDTARSLMPDNFSELLSDQDLAHLLQFVMQGQ